MPSDMNYKVVKLDSTRCNFTFITDLHLSAVAPGRRSDDYQKSILGKVRFVQELTHKIKGVGLCGGDVFHSKNAKSASNSLSLLTETLEEFKKFPFGCLWGVPGNHDLSGDQLDSIPSQPIGVLLAAGVYHDLSVAPVVFINEDESVKVLVEALPYEHRGTLERILNPILRPEGVDYRIGIVHAYGQPGEESSLFGSPIIGYNQCAGSDYDFLLWGHDHSRKETQEVGGTTHVHLGSLARAALDMDEVDRPVSCAVISFAADGVRFKEREIPVHSLEVAFTVADKPMDNVAKSDEIKDFFADMDEKVGDIETTDPKEVLKTICPDEDRPVLDLVYEVCEF